jgi:hypothetical protein
MSGAPNANCQSLHTDQPLCRAVSMSLIELSG